MLRRLADLVGLREGEGERTVRLLSFLFLVTLSIVLLKAAQRGIFLAAYPRSRIADAFMLSAAFLAGFSFLAAAVAPRLGRSRGGFDEHVEHERHAAVAREQERAPRCRGSPARAGWHPRGW